MWNLGFDGLVYFTYNGDSNIRNIECQYCFIHWIWQPFILVLSLLSLVPSPPFQSQYDDTIIMQYAVVLAINISVSILPSRQLPPDHDYLVISATIMTMLLLPSLTL